MGGIYLSVELHGSDPKTIYVLKFAARSLQYRSHCSERQDAQCMMKLYGVWKEVAVACDLMSRHALPGFRRLVNSLC